MISLVIRDELDAVNLSIDSILFLSGLTAVEKLKKEIPNIKK